MVSIGRWVLAGAVGASASLIGINSASALTPVGADLVVNGSFESPDIPTGTFRLFASIPGWSTSSALEIQDNVAGAPATGAGGQFLELDSNGPTRVFQTIPTTQGKTYRLTYIYSARPGTAAADNHFAVTAGSASQEIGPIAGGPQTSWLTSTLDFVATAASTEISFRDIGPANGLGGYIDSVSVQLLDPPAAQAITFTSTPPATPVVGDTYMVAATATSGLTVAFSADGVSAGICTVTGATVSFTGDGTCRINADQAGNSSYLAAPQVQQTVTMSAVPAAPVAPVFTPTSPPAAAVPVAPLVVPVTNTPASGTLPRTGGEQTTLAFLAMGFGAAALGARRLQRRIRT